MRWMRRARRTGAGGAFDIDGFNAQQTARVIEERLNVTDSLFVNGVDFASGPERNDSPQLRERVLRMLEARDRSARPAV